MTGLTYDDPATGMHLDFNKITLPKGFKKESGKPLHLEHVDLNEARFKVDVSKLGGGRSGGTSYKPTDFEFLNKVVGHVNANLLLVLDSHSVVGTLNERAQFRVDINHGAFNYNTLRGQVPYLIRREAGLRIR